MGIHHEDEINLEDGYELIRWCNYFHEPPSERAKTEYRCPVWTWFEDKKHLLPGIIENATFEYYCDQCPYIGEKMARVRLR